MVVSFQTMGNRNDEANNRYRLRNRKQNNCNGGLSINKQGSDDTEEEEEEEEEVDRPHQRRRVDEANTGDPEENLDMPVDIDFEGDLDQN